MKEASGSLKRKEAPWALRTGCVELGKPTGSEVAVPRTERGGHGGGAGGSAFPATSPLVPSEGHARAPPRRVTEARPRPAAAVSYLDRWADSPKFRHCDTTKTSCTGRGNGPYILRGK